MADQRDRQAFATGTAGAADTVHVLVAGARHVEVDHQVQAFDIQATSGDVGGHQHFGSALLHALDGQLAVLLVLFAVEHERLVATGHQMPVQAIGLGAGVGEDDRLLVGLVGQQPARQLFLVLGMVGRDDLLAGVLVELVDAVQPQVQRIAQHAGGHLAQRGATGGGGEQQGLLAVGAEFGDALHVLGKAHVEHAVGFVQHQHFHLAQIHGARVQVFDQAAGRGDQHVGQLAQHRCLHLEVFPAGDDAGLDEGELGKALHLFQGLLRQLAGRQQDQRADALAGLGLANQAVEQRQDEGGGLAATGLGGHPQVAPFQGRRDSRRLHRGRLDEFEFGNGLEQTFVQGELGKHGATSIKSVNSCIG
ncbi:hypothetical protein D9M69_221360 [compost metagenome]